MIYSAIFLFIFSLFPTKWQVFKSYDGKFSVEIPCATMEEKVQQIPTPMGELEYHTFVCAPPELDAENKVFLISYVDYPSAILHPDSLDLKRQLLATSIESSVESLKGTLLYQDEITYKGEQGFFWRIDYNKGNAVMKTKAFIVKNRMYLIQVATEKARSRNLEADKYLNSFTWF
jgi:hypothetical protein